MNVPSAPPVIIVAAIFARWEKQVADCENLIVQQVNVLLISQGASSINLTFVVEERHAAEVVRRLHAAFFECATAELLAYIGGAQ